MLTTGTLGAAFLVIGLVAMFLMYHLWGYPFDKATRTSAAPRWAMWLHRILGYAFLVIYVVLMWRMVPRLWEYQVEFPARTTVHIVLGFTIGFLLLIKIAIVRFFRHFEEWMPYLGTAIMLGTVILLGLSLPYAFQERALASAAFEDDNRARVATLLPGAGMPEGAPLAELSSKRSLAAGRTVLLESCVKCHDLKTILAKPRTPSGWWSVVERMAEKPALFAPMTEREMYDVTAYLVAITPSLQKASKKRYQTEVAREDALIEARAARAGAEAVLGAPIDVAGTSIDPDATPDAVGPDPTTPTTPTTPTGTGTGSATPPVVAVKPATKPVDLARAKATYEDVCAQCHDLSDVDAAPPTTRAESRAMVKRMIMENEAELTASQIALVTAWLDAHFVDKQR